MTTSQHDLLNCTHCGASHPTLTTVQSVQSTKAVYMVVCRKCNMRTPQGNKASAIAAWNARKPLTDAETTINFLTGKLNEVTEKNKFLMSLLGGTID
jgi:transcription elongation factor Elf1